MGLIMLNLAIIYQLICFKEMQTLLVVGIGWRKLIVSQIKLGLTSNEEFNPLQERERDRW